jgi:hypothetical protein
MSKVALHLSPGRYEISVFFSCDLHMSDFPINLVQTTFLQVSHDSYLLRPNGV